MTFVSLGRPVLASSADLSVRRTGIQFHNLSRDRVRIEIEVENHGSEPSRPARMRVEVAPLGAFLPWRTLATLAVPPIPPGGSTTVTTEATQPRPGASPGFRSLVPRDLRTLTGSGDERSRRWSARGAALTLAGLLARSRSHLPPDLLELLAGEQTHWAGNLNVWLDDRPVERHMAPRLRIHAGRPNVAIFAVGGPDEYGFRMAGHGSDWPSVLWDACWNQPVECSQEDWREPSWHPIREDAWFFLVLRPPQDCGSGVAEVHVTQRSTGRTALVEFDLDPSAQGPGCYTV